MITKDIYKLFDIPPNLQDHLIAVAKISNLIATHWQDKNIHISDLIKISLLHDLGNIVKFNFEKFPIDNIDYWKQKQKEIIEKYGDNDHDVTKKMLEEINIDIKLIQIILNKSFDNSINISKSSDWMSKILLYADLRVLPNGVGTLQQRLDDIKNRMDKYKNRPDLLDLFSACFEIEKQIQSKINLNVDTINQELINNDHFDYLNFEI